MLHNIQWITEGIKEEIKNMHRDKWKWRHNDPNLYAAPKAVLRGKFIAMKAYLRKQAKYQINNLALNLKQLEKEE